MQVLAFAMQRNRNRDFQRLAAESGKLIGQMFEAAELDDSNAKQIQSDVDNRIVELARHSFPGDLDTRALIGEFFEEFVKTAWLAQLEAHLTDDARFRQRLMQMRSALLEMQASAGRAGSIPDSIRADFERRLRPIAPGLAEDFSEPFPS